MNQRGLQITLRLILLIIAIGLRIFIVAEKSVLEYDDAISLLVATGHEGEYARISAEGRFPIGEWVPAQEWKRLIEPEPGRGLRQVAADLAAYDIHPPLYFWILHLWTNAFGAGPVALHTLNFVFDAAILLVLFWSAAQVFQDRLAGLLVSLTWALSPIAIKTSFWIRQYTLMGLLTLLFAYLLYLSFGHRRGRKFLRSDLALALVTLAGLFTNYYFAIIIAVGVFTLALNAHLQRRTWAKAAGLVGILAFMGLLFFFLYPGIQTSVAGYLETKFQPVSEWAHLPVRLRNTLKTLILLYSPAAAGLGVFLLGVFGSWNSNRGKEAGSLRERLAAPALFQSLFFRWMVVFSILPVVIITLLHLTGVSQAHTISSRYLGFISPFVAFVTVFLVQATPLRIRLIFLFYAGMLALGLATLFPNISQSQEGALEITALRTAPLLVIDTIEWGTWPAVVQHLEDDQQIFVANQGELLSRPEAWIDSFQNGGIYVSFVRGNENTRQARQELLKLIESRYKVAPQSELFRRQDWTITLFSVQPASAASK